MAQALVTTIRSATVTDVPHTISVDVSGDQTTNDLPGLRWARLIVDDGESRIYLFEPRDLAAEFNVALEYLLTEPAFVRDRALGYNARRMTCAYGQEGLSYRYSGVTKRPQPWPLALAGIVVDIARWTSAEYNFCLANLYPDHTATLGWHADDERDLVPDSPITIVSLGSSRLLGLQRIADGHTQSVELTHGSVLVMAGATQRRYKHCSCKGVAGSGPRVSLTLRRVRSA